MRNAAWHVLFGATLAALPAFALCRLAAFATLSAAALCIVTFFAVMRGWLVEAVHNDALDHSLESPNKILSIYALENRIRLCASEDVVAAAAHAIRTIGEQYMKENLAAGELKKVVLTAFSDPEQRIDPLRPFSEACRRELAGLASAI